MHCVIELVPLCLWYIEWSFWKPMIRLCYEWCYSNILFFFIPIPTFFSSSRINWWKLWLSMDCLSIWQAGHYLANGNIVIIPKWAIMLDQLYEAATSVSWKAKFCVNLYRGWTPSSFFDHQISSLEWCSVMAFKNASARFGSYHTRIQQLSAKNQSLKMLQFRN